MLYRSHRCYISVLLIFGLLGLSRSIPRLYTHRDHGSDPITVILAAMARDNITHLYEDSGIKQGDHQVVYLSDNPISADRHIPMNKGREAMVYLSYLIDNYRSLPELMIFMHGGRTSWHNNFLLHHNSSETVSRLQRPYIRSQGFVNLACDWQLSCKTMCRATEAGPLAYCLTRMHLKDPYLVLPSAVSSQAALFRKLWTEILPRRPVPDSLVYPTGAQFALTRQTALSVPLAELQRLRKWIIQTDLDEKAAGAVLEAFWHMIFDKRAGPDECVNPRLCYCRLYGICFKNDDAFGEVMSWLEVVEKLYWHTKIISRYAPELRTESVNVWLRNITDGLWDPVRRNVEEVLAALQAKSAEAERRIDVLTQKALNG